MAMFLQLITTVGGGLKKEFALVILSSKTNSSVTNGTMAALTFVIFIIFFFGFFSSFLRSLL
jgi:hypothetical protein